MNRQSAANMIPMLQAFADGKDLEVRTPAGVFQAAGEDISINWFQRPEQLRIAKPKRFVNLYSSFDNKVFCGYIYTNKQDAVDAVGSDDCSSTFLKTIQLD